MKITSRFRQIKISTRILYMIIMLVLLIFGIVSIFALSFNDAKKYSITQIGQTIMDYQKEKLQIATHSMAVGLGDMINDTLSQEQKEEFVINAIDNIRFEEDGSGYFFVYRGTINIAHPIKKEFRGTDRSDSEDPNGVKYVKLLSEKADKGGGFVEYSFDKPGKGIQPKISYCEMIPGTDMWISSGVYVDNIIENQLVVEKEFNSKNNQTLLRIFIIVFIVLFVIVIPFSITVRKSIKKGVEETIKVTTAFSSGDFFIEMPESHKDELGIINESLNNLKTNLVKAADFAEKIGEGVFDVDFSVLGSNDVLGNSLVRMRDSLKNAKHEESLRQKEEEKRNWATIGQAKFADILRQDNSDINKLSFNVILNLVKYLNANQGGLFILNDDNQMDLFLELKACYAYDRQKFMTKKILPGEGLVGTCYLEKNKIYLTDVPQDYIHITSGLGQENPDCILIVPLVFNESVFGVIEIASFERFEDYQIAFVEKVAESIASTISTVKINLRTSFLLEQSQQQAEEMKAQEEEMRQNMEEMNATQEEMARKEGKLKSLTETADSFLCIAEYDSNGCFVKINQNYIDVLGYSLNDLVGKPFHSVINIKSASPTAGISAFLEKINNGEVVKSESEKVKKNGEIIKIRSIANPVIENGSLIRIVEFFFVIGN